MAKKSQYYESESQNNNVINEQSDQVVNQESQQKYEKKEKKINKVEKGSDDKNNKQKKSQKDKKKQIKSFDVLSSLIVSFFHEIKQEKALIFPEDMRRKLILIYPNLNFTPEAYYDPDVEWQKLVTIMKKSKLWVYLQSNSTVQALERFQKEIQEEILEEIQQASYIFAQQTTSQFYDIMIRVLDIICQFYNDSAERVARLQELGNGIVTNTVPGSDYLFMSFNFVNHPQTGERRTQLDEKFRKKYTLKKQYREKGGPYAGVIKRAGDICRKIIQELSFRKMLPIKFKR